jgi:hypothetical protein
MTTTLFPTRPDALLPASLPFVGATPVGRGRAEASIGSRFCVIGRLFTMAWSAGAHPVGAAVSSEQVFRAVADMAADPAPVGLDAEVGLVGSHLDALHDLTEQSWSQMLQEISRFTRFLETEGVACLEAVSVELTREFIQQPIRDRAGRWAEPGSSKLHSRRGAIRMLYGTAYDLRLVTRDPTRFIKLPARDYGDVRPLADDEILLGRQWTRAKLVDTAHAAAWALAEASATTTELASVTIRDLDLAAAQVWLHGNEKKREPRWGALTEWGVEQIARHVEAVDGTAA